MPLHNCYEAKKSDRETAAPGGTAKFGVQVASQSCPSPIPLKPGILSLQAISGSSGPENVLGSGSSVCGS